MPHGHDCSNNEGLVTKLSDKDLQNTLNHCDASEQLWQKDAGSEGLTHHE